MAKPGARDRVRSLRTFVNEEERRVINTRATEAGMSVSAYLRAAAMGMAPRAALDLKAVETLAAINADQSRLYTLAMRGQTHLLSQIETMQQELVRVVSAIRT